MFVKVRCTDMNPKTKLRLERKRDELSHVIHYLERLERWVADAPPEALEYLGYTQIKSKTNRALARCVEDFRAIQDKLPPSSPPCECAYCNKQISVGDWYTIAPSGPKCGSCYSYL